MNYKDRVIELLKDLERPIVDTEIAEMLKIPAKEIEDLRSCLKGLLEEGLLVKTKKHKYGSPESFGLIRGRIQITQKGFGFLIPDDEERDDIFIPAVMTMGAMNGDEVFVTLTEKSLDNKKPEGKVERIVKRKFTEIVGNFESSKKFGFVVPDDPKINQDIFISKSNFAGAVDGQKVVAKILRYPDARRNPEGKIIEILGDKDDVGVDVLSIIKQHKLREAFPSRVLKEAEGIPLEIPEAALKGRKDLRQETIVTIDGADAKDLDDAISLKVLDNGHYLLGVHIADVAQYVKEGSALDEEAYLRGTSVYLIDRVLPMLPEALSNGMCSLNPRVDRLTLSAEMEIDDQGKVVAHKVYESVINSKYRLTYDEVSNLLEGTREEPGLKPIADLLRLMGKLSDLLTEARYRRGSIDFDFAESFIELDEKGHPVNIEKRERRVGHRLIESFMLAANETVAEHYHTKEMPFLYRVHEVPTSEKIDDFNKFVYNFGYKLKGDSENIHPKAVQELIEKVKGTKEEHIISKLMLRSLTQARYYHKELGHFGLSAKYYSHFTSPIRRYPDLMIHRIIKEDLRGKITDSKRAHYEKILPDIGKSTSITERTAEKAERDVDDLKMAEYMMDKIGEAYKGMISSVTSFGFFVELESTVEGLVRMVDLEDDFYHFDASRLELVGERRKKVYRIGDEVEVKVSAVSLDSRTIDFQLA